MAANTTGDFIRSVFPSIVNRTGDVFGALFANEEGKGTLEVLFDDLEESRLQWQGDSDNVYNQTGSQLEKTRRLLSPFNRHLSDTDTQIVKRLYTLLYRTGDTLWGTKWDIINCVRYYLEVYDVFIVNNAQDYASSLLSNGDFEENTEDTSGTLVPTGWTVSGSATYSSEDDEHFEESHGMAFTAADGVCSQSVTLEAASIYWLHFFLSGIIRVALVDPDGLYWDADALSWTSDECFATFENTSSDDWQEQSLHFTTGDAGVYTLIFQGAEDESKGCVDLAMMFLNTTAPSYLVVAVYNGDTSVMIDGAHYAVQGADSEETWAAEGWDFDSFHYFAPEETPAGMDYSLVGFYPGLSGSFTQLLLTNEILKVLSPAGVSYYAEILDRTSSSSSDDEE